MISWFVLVFIFSLFLTIFYRKRRKRLEREFDEKFQNFQEQVFLFNSELKKILSHYVDKDEESSFVAKWQDLYSEIFKYYYLKKFNECVDFRIFLKDYKSIHDYIRSLNEEIKRQESIRIAEIKRQEAIRIAEIKRRKSIQALLPRIEAFFDELSELRKQYITHLDEVCFTQKWQNLLQDVESVDIRLCDEEYDQFVDLKSICASFRDYFQRTNAAFIQNESQRCDDLLSNVDGKSLDLQQRTAVINDENRILVLAGAGSGKTLTIAAKVKYLCEKKSVDPKDILLISFTKKSAQEMTDRIQGKLGIQVEALTFHKLGLEIIKRADGFRPEVADEPELSSFIHNFFEKELINYPDLIRVLTEYFAYYLEIPEDIENYRSLGELYEAEKNVDLETIKFKYEQQKYIHENSADKAKALTTLKNEKVKSLEETKIANFLFLNGIDYEYEKLYPYESEDPLRKSYHPDFYLTDYDIYLEHFGVSRRFTLPWLSPIEEKKYLDGILWKRDFHKMNGTKLIETYSYYNSEGILLKKLKELLEENNVEFKPRDFVDVFNTVYKTKSSKYLAEFIKLCCTFITLFKSNNYKVEEIEDLREYAVENGFNKFLIERTNLFLDIITILLTGYQKHLLANNAIDFSDMINNAADKVNSGCAIPNYRYIIVDEYQDISKSRFNLLKSVVERTGAKLFCVGDDWQSIYRFAGSDVSLFTDFEKYFGYTEILKIEKTYRNSQQLIDEASRFILKNSLQLKKELRSDKSLNYPLVFWGYEKDPTLVLKNAINKIISEFGVESSILLLGRTNYDREILEQSGLFKIVRKNKKDRLVYLPFPELNIEFLSVHKSKGLEADNVIILNFKNDKLGFPNQIEDDEILNLVLTSAENYRFAEERRLFYVAITRTKNRTFILTDNVNPSLFFKEFPESSSVCYASFKKRTESQSYCPLCKTGTLLKVDHEGKSFIGCSNYPRCRYTISNPTILQNSKICPNCGGFLTKRKGRNNHWFVGCTNYPNCNYTESLENGMSRDIGGLIILPK